MSLARDAGVAGRPSALPALRLRVLWFPAAFIFACLLPVLLYIPFLQEPFMRDEGFYAAVAQLVLDGGIPYRDAFDNKPPMIFAYYAFSFVVFGEGIWAPRLLVALMLSGATAVMYLLARQMFTRNWALLAATAFALSLGLAQFETNANVEYFMLLPFNASILAYLLARKSGSAWLYLVAGLLAGITLMNKETALFVYALLPVDVAWGPLREDGLRAVVSRRVLRPVMLLAIGAIAAGFVISLPFIVTGTFGDMYEALVIYTVKYVGGGKSTLDKVIVLAKSPLYLLFLAGPWFVLAVLGVIQAIRTNPGGRALFLVGFMVTSWLGIAAAGRFYDHYYVGLLPAFALLLPLGAQMLIEWWRNKYARILIAGLVPLTLISPLYFAGEIYIQPNPEERHAAKYPGEDKTLWEIEAPELARWLTAATDESDYIYNLGFNPEIYFYSGRRSPTRYMFDHPFLVGSKYTEAAIQELEANYPLYVIDTASLDRDRESKYFAKPIYAWIRDNYDYLGRIYYADVYRLSEGVGD